MLLCTNPSERFLVFVERELRKAGSQLGTSGAPAGTPGCGAALPSPGAVHTGHLSCLAPLGPGLTPSALELCVCARLFFQYSCFAPVFPPAAQGQC